MDLTIEDLRLNFTKKIKFENFLKSCKKDLKKEKAIIKGLFTNLSKEEHDVEKLKKLSFTSLYHSLLGDKHDKINKETQEYFTAKLKFDSCQNSISNLKKDIDLYNKKIKTAQEFETKTINDLKDADVLKPDDKIFIEIIEERTALKAIKIEIHEAIKIGLVVKTDLVLAHKFMSSASNWGIGDMFGGGIIVTAVKHNKIKNAEKKMENVKKSILEFQRELKDINNLNLTTINLNVGSFLTFADYFADGIIFDWMVQSKINKSKKLLDDAISETRKVITTLYSKLDKANHRQDELQNKQLLSGDV